MKIIKLLLVTLLVTSAFTTSAQITKRNWMLGGDINFWYHNVERLAEDGEIKTQFDNLSLETQANIGYFVADKLAAGINLSIYSYKYIGDEMYSKDLALRTIIGPYIRYYILDLNENTNVFTEIGFNKEIVSFQGETQHFKRIDYFAKVGTSIFLNDIVSVDLSIKYNRVNEYSDKINKISFGAGFQLFLTKK